MEKITHNEIKVTHLSTNNSKFGLDSFGIEISNTSYGAMVLFRRKLQEMYETEKRETDGGLTGVAYLGLLKKLSKELENKIPYPQRK